MSSLTKERRRGTILVVDDDFSIRLLARTTLMQAGYDVMEAENGRQAVEMFSAAAPDVILLDILMPVMDGFQVCTAVRALPNGKDVPIIIMTGLEDNESISTAYNAGATDFITKPISWPTLAFRVHYIYRASQAFRDLKESEARLSQAQRIAHMGSWEWDPAEDSLRVSETCHLILDLPAEHSSFTLSVLLAMIHPEDVEHLKLAFDDAVNRLQPIRTDVRIVTSDHEAQRHIHLEAEARKTPHNEAVMVTGTLQDISERKQSEEQIRFLAYYDNLTRLPNRILFREHLGRAMALAKRNNRKLSILFLDLDRFKEINDSLGHTAGDLLLQEIAERLQHCIRQSDVLCRKSSSASEWRVARLGGDEFMILLEDIAGADNATVVARRLIESFSHPFKLPTCEVYITCSIGIGLFPDDASDPETLVKNADIAMYAAKELGRNTFQFYKTEMNTATLQRLMLENLLRGAIERGELLLHYQPQVDLATGRLVGLEALVRWQRPEMGLVSPVTFIPIAEESGLIFDIDAWVLNAVCRQLKQWQEQGIAPVRISVNLSGRHFQRNTLSTMVSRALVESGAAPHLLELELTEGVLMQNISETVETLTLLRKMGLYISIDDFGTGYSSLSYIKNFPLTTLKIDRSFIKEINRGLEGPAIIKAIIALAKGLGLELVAEGVETEEQAEFLGANGCTVIQGFLYSKPMPLTEVSKALAEGRLFKRVPKTESPNQG